MSMLVTNCRTCGTFTQNVGELPITLKILKTGVVVTPNFGACKGAKETTFPPFQGKGKITLVGDTFNFALVDHLCVKKGEIAARKAGISSSGKERRHSAKGERDFSIRT